MTTAAQARGGNEVHLTVWDKDFRLVWRYDSLELRQLAPAVFPIDKVSHMFFDYDPGRYNGVIVLAATNEGIDAFSSLPDFSNGEAPRFYGAYVVDVNADGTNEIRIEQNDCVPSCADGTLTTRDLSWDGSDYS